MTAFPVIKQLIQKCPTLGEILQYLENIFFPLNKPFRHKNEYPNMNSCNFRVGLLAKHASVLVVRGSKPLPHTSPRDGSPIRKEDWHMEIRCALSFFHMTAAISDTLISLWRHYIFPQQKKKKDHMWTPWIHAKFMKDGSSDICGDRTFFLSKGRGKSPFSHDSAILSAPFAAHSTLIVLTSLYFQISWDEVGENKNILVDQLQSMKYYPGRYESDVQELK